MWFHVCSLGRLREMISAVVLTLCCIISVILCHSQTQEPKNPAVDNGCPVWWTNGTSKPDEGSAVQCMRNDNGDYHISFLPCYCVTEYKNSLSAVVGLCQYTCTENLPLLHYISLPPHVNVSELSRVVCKNFSRKGQMCGECKTKHALAAYSYTLNCVDCSQSKMNWLKYVGVAFGPQTLFFIFIVLGRISVTSGLMVGYVTVSQVIATGVELRFKTSELHSRYDFNRVNSNVNFFFTVYSIWNLDFFRGLYTPFCLHPDVSPLAVISLDYAVAVYPLLLITVTYLMLLVCGKCKFSGAPLYRLTRRCYQEWDIRDSIVDAFATALILSYVKILNVSFALLLPVPLKDQNGVVKEIAVYYSGNLKYFGPEHLPYAVLAMLMFLSFNILPLVLLTLYPCHCFQLCLNKCWKGSGVHNVMDNFYRCYKTSPRDCRLFGVVYLYLRLFNLCLLLVALSPAYLNLVSLLYLSMAMLIALVRPHQVNSHNIINATLFFLIAATKLLENALEFSLGAYERVHFALFSGIVSFLFCVPPLYGLIVLLYHLLPKRLHVKHVLNSILRKFRSRNTVWNEESLAHRVSHADQYAHLLNVSK